MVSPAPPVPARTHDLPATPTSIHNAPHYTWGTTCDGWHLVKHPTMSVIQERMPPGTSEVRHFHSKARQFFFVLRGEATMELDGITHRLRAQEGLEVAPGAPHTMQNRSDADIEFLVVSCPPSHGDRTMAPL